MIRQPQSAWRRQATLVAGLALLSVAVYLPSLGNELVWDAEASILGDPAIRDPRHLPELFTEIWVLDPQGAQLAYYRPLVRTLHTIEWGVFGDWAAGYKAISLLLHALVVALAFLLAATLSPDRRAALGAAVLFAVNPTHSEAICWVHSDSNLLMGVFALASVLAWTRGRRGWALLLFVPALLSRETAVLLPLVLLAFEVCLGRGPRRPRALWLGGGLALALAFVALRGSIGGELPITAEAPLALLQAAAVVLARFVRLIAWPDAPVAVYIHETGRPLAGGLELTLAWATVAALIAGLALAWRRDRALAFWLLWFLLWPAATYNIGRGAAYLMAEKTLLLASLGPLMIGTTLLFRWVPGRAAAGVIVALTLVHGAVSADRARAWRDTGSYLESLVAFEPRFAVGWAALGGHYARAQQHQRALVAYRRALALRPGAEHLHRAMAESEFALGLDALGAGRSAEATAAFERAVHLDPRHAGALTNLGNLRLAQGELSAARQAYEAALRARPDDLLPRYNLSLVLERLRRRRRVSPHPAAAPDHP